MPGTRNLQPSAPVTSRVLLLSQVSQVSLLGLELTVEQASLKLVGFLLPQILRLQACATRSGYILIAGETGDLPVSALEELAVPVHSAWPCASR